jgi:hypothetical protein
MSTKSKRRVQRRVVLGDRASDRAWAGIGPGTRKQRKATARMADRFNTLLGLAYDAKRRGENAKGDALARKANALWATIQKRKRAAEKRDLGLRALAASHQKVIKLERR